MSKQEDSAQCDKTGGRALVSVIMLMRNRDVFLSDAIESVLAQTYPHWELLLVDDGATARSTAIAQEYTQRYPDKIRHFAPQDSAARGMSGCHHWAGHQARGIYLTFMKVDDLLYAHKLQRQVAILDAQPDTAFVFGRTQHWYSWTGTPDDRPPDGVPQLTVPLNAPIRPPTLLPLCLRNDWAVLWDAMIRRETVEAVGSATESMDGVDTEQAFYAHLCLSFPAFVSGESWYRSRQYPQARDSMGHNTTSQHVGVRHRLLNELAAYLNEQVWQESTAWEILDKEMWGLRHPTLHGMTQRLRHWAWLVKSLIRKTGLRAFPISCRRWLRAQWRCHMVSPPVGSVNLGDLRCITPISREFGFDRGLPIDRYYIEGFLARQRQDIHGRMLELGDNTYTRRFGGKRVRHSDVLHAPVGVLSPESGVTIVADLTRADHVSSDTFDCIILTQTLLLIYDVRAAIQTVYRILKPGGVLLGTVPGISQIIREDRQLWGEYWRFTTQSIQQLFAEVFPPDRVTTEAHGNVLTATAFLYGLATQEFLQEELDYHDPDYEVIITVRAVKPGWPS